MTALAVLSFVAWAVGLWAFFDEKRFDGLDALIGLLLCVVGSLGLAGDLIRPERDPINVNDYRVEVGR